MSATPTPRRSRRRRQQTLERVLGTPALFATAYGNVGSSIYYALGLVAAHALGLTPLVFIFAGGLFALTAKTYAEGASMFPEAGGSSSFARHAFNEVVSFFAGWGLSLDYIITVAISAFFVPHYLAVFWHPLRHGPGDVIGLDPRAILRKSPPIATIGAGKRQISRRIRKFRSSGDEPAISG